MYRTIAVIGLGYVGLPLALTFSQEGYRVVGVDLDMEKIQSIRLGKSYVVDIQNETLATEVASGNFTATNDYRAIGEVDAIVVCVPTPLNEENIPDLSFLVTAGKEINKHIRKEQLIILESSTYPGTTKELLLPLLEQQGLVVGKDFYLGYSPERIDPGNHSYSFKSIPKIISGVTEACTQKVYELYSLIFDQVVTVSSTEAAELAKLLENTYRYVNISFINEFATLCDYMKINAWEVIEAASSKPYGFSKFLPGPGVGGHCIPVDPLYLQWKVQDCGLSSSFIKLSVDINSKMPAYITSQIKAHLPSSTLNGARIFILGITYKKDINDIRESPALEIMRELIQKGCSLDYHDPFVPEITLDGVIYRSKDLSKANLVNTDCVIIATDHSQLPIKSILQHATFIYDTRNITQGLSGNAKVIRLGGGR